MHLNMRLEGEETDPRQPEEGEESERKNKSDRLETKAGV